MNRPGNDKKAWIKPSVKALSIRKDTFSGSGTGVERAGKAGPPTKKG